MVNYFQSGFTPLHLASQEGHTDMVSLLLQKGAEVNCRAKVNIVKKSFYKNSTL